MTNKNVIEKVELMTFGDWQTIYIKGDLISIGKIAAFVSELNNENLKTKKDEKR